METAAAMLLVLLAGYCTVRTRFVQFRRFPGAVRAFFTRPKSISGGVTPFQACATSLGATVGTGNIAGTAGAVLLGGPGAIFWMWVSALLGMGSKYLEIYFSVRCSCPRGDSAGPAGPMRYIERGLGARFRPLAVSYALFCLAAAFTTGNLVQLITLGEGYAALLAQTDFGAYGGPPVSFACGAVCAALLAPVLFGGAQRTGRVAAALVPLMSALYVLFSLALILSRAAELPSAFGRIFDCALHPRAALCGAAGAGASAPFRVGIARGMFSHEAGIGTAALAHGSVERADAHRQALYGVFEVFLDTLVLCTLTALSLLVSGIPLPCGDSSDGVALIVQTFSPLLGGRFSGTFVAATLALFAFTSVLSFSLYGCHCTRYLFGERAVPFYRILFLGVCTCACFVPAAAAWKAAEWSNALAAIVNSAALFLLCERSRAASLRRTKPRVP